MKLRKPTGWRIVDLAARLAILAALFYAWHANDNGLAFALAVVIAVWSITAFMWWAVRQSRTTSGADPPV
jgi:peptidoglycan biosynthesis protein MviN/MurJ (putative lipid II flippase)